MPIPKKVRLRPNEQRHSVREVMHGLSEGGGPRGRLTCPSIGLPAGKPARGAPDAGHAACRSRFHEGPILNVLERRQLRAEGSRLEKPPRSGGTASFVLELPPPITARRRGHLLSLQAHRRRGQPSESRPEKAAILDHPRSGRPCPRRRKGPAAPLHHER
jgi:hypothetical protein